MIVVSDTSALTSLLQIGEIGVLASLFGEIFIPEAVERELLHDHAALPAFIHVARARNRALVLRLAGELDLGEAEAIALTVENRGDLLLIDERKGRRVAMREGIRVIGLLGVLSEAKRRGFLPSLRTTLDQLRTVAGFRVSAELTDRLLRDAGE